MGDARAQRDQWAHDDSLRWLQDRQQAYARLATALDAWDVALYKAVNARNALAMIGKFRSSTLPSGTNCAKRPARRRALTVHVGRVTMNGP
jgi:hypothetical protein